MASGLARRKLHSNLSKQRGGVFHNPAVANSNSTQAWRAVSRVLRSSSGHVLATLFASECRLCDAPLDSDSELPVCGLCLAEAAAVPGHPLCALCGEAFEPDSAAAHLLLRDPSQTALCAVCSEHPRAFAKAAAHGDYEGLLRELIYLLKFEGVRSAAVPLGRWAAEAADEKLAEAKRDVIVTAVPLFSSKRRQRGFNQAEAIAASAARELKRRGWRVTERNDLLARTRLTRSQSELNIRQRRANLRGAFGPTAAAPEIAGREVLLVDDIMTTGTTAHLCAVQLVKAGAEKVWVATAARSQPPMFAPFGQEDLGEP